MTEENNWDCHVRLRVPRVRRHVHKLVGSESCCPLDKSPNEFSNKFSSISASSWQLPAVSEARQQTSALDTAPLHTTRHENTKSSPVQQMMSQDLPAVIHKGVRELHSTTGHIERQCPLELAVARALALASTLDPFHRKSKMQGAGEACQLFPMCSDPETEIQRLQMHPRDARHRRNCAFTCGRGKHPSDSAHRWAKAKLLSTSPHLKAKSSMS